MSDTDFSKWDIRCLIKELKGKLTREELERNSREYVCVEVGKCDSDDMMARCGFSYTLGGLIKYLLKNWKGSDRYAIYITSSPLETEPIRGELLRRIEAYEKKHGTISLP